MPFPGHAAVIAAIRARAQSGQITTATVTAQAKPGVRIELISEVAISTNPARVLVYDETNQLIAEIVASIEREQGADGTWYGCVKLQQRQ